MCDSLDKLAYMGPGYPLFFLFSKYAVVILTAIFLVSGLYGLYSNYSGTACSDDDDLDDECYSNTYMLLSLANKKNDTDAMNFQLWLNCAVVPIVIIIIQVMRRHVRKTSSECDERDISASDYTVMVEHIPKSKDVDYQKELKELFEKQPPMKVGGKDVKFEVCKINLTYNLEELYK